MKCVLVTGGSGFLGINLIRYLLAQGVQEVRSLDIAPFDYPEKDIVKATLGDIRDEVVLRQCLQGCDGVVHCAAALPLCSDKEIYSTDIYGAKLVAKNAKQLGIKRYVYISSTAVYGIPEHHPLVESDTLEGVGPYGISKITTEAYLHLIDSDEFPVTILRPKSFIGPERLGIFALLYDWAFTGHNFPVIGSGNNLYQLMDVEDLCAAIWLSLTAPIAAARETYNVGAKEFSTMRDDYQVVLDAAGHGKHIIGTPASLAVWALRILEFFHLSPIYKWVYATAGKESFVSIDKICTKLNWQPKYSNKQALLRNYQWYIEHRSQFAGKCGTSHRVPWRQGILTLIKKFF